jgi:hypothetical protein
VSRSPTVTRVAIEDELIRFFRERNDGSSGYHRSNSSFIGPRFVELSKPEVNVTDLADLILGIRP